MVIDDLLTKTKKKLQLVKTFQNSTYNYFNNGVFFSDVAFSRSYSCRILESSSGKRWLTTTVVHYKHERFKFPDHKLSTNVYIHIQCLYHILCLQHVFLITMFTCPSNVYRNSAGFHYMETAPVVITSFNNSQR